MLRRYTISIVAALAVVCTYRLWPASHPAPPPPLRDLDDTQATLRLYRIDDLAGGPSSFSLSTTAHAPAAPQPGVSGGCFFGPAGADDTSIEDVLDSVNPGRALPAQVDGWIAIKATPLRHAQIEWVLQELRAAQHRPLFQTEAP